MRSVVLLLGLAVVASAEYVEVQTSYHESVGFPRAAMIKAAEEAHFKAAENQNGDGTTQEERIVGGAIAPANAHPYLGGLIISFWGTSGNSVCGSSLLSANRLVTAAHCWFDGTWQAWQFQVVLGSQFLFLGGGTRIATSQVVMHPQYFAGTLLNDVAMIYLPTNVFFTNSIQPLALPSGSQLWESFNGWWAIAAGYGITSDAQTGVSSQTQVSHVNLQVITVAQCAAVFGSVWVQPSTLCTSGAGGVGVCGGDSGGPLVVNQGGQNILIGISSFVASNACQRGHPSGFARVTSFSNFIAQHMW